MEMNSHTTKADTEDCRKLLKEDCKLLSTFCGRMLHTKHSLFNTELFALLENIQINVILETWNHTFPVNKSFRRFGAADVAAVGSCSVAVGAVAGRVVVTVARTETHLNCIRLSWLMTPRNRILFAGPLYVRSSTFEMIGTKQDWISSLFCLNLDDVHRFQTKNSKKKLNTQCDWIMVDKLRSWGWKIRLCVFVRQFHCN